MRILPLPSCFNYTKLKKKRFFSKASKEFLEMQDDQFQFSTEHSGFSIFLAERTKKVHFIRHAEGFHNTASKDTGSNDCLIDNMAMWDARLTPRGIEQCQKLRRHLATRPSQGRSFTHFDLIVVSPLTRTLETAHHIFGPPRKPGVPSFLAEQFNKTGLPRPQFLVREECRERWGHYSCDGRRPIREIIKEFPDADFSQVEHDEDEFFTKERETSDHCMERAVHFLEWLNKRPERCIAVVTHSSFLRHLFAQFGSGQSLDDKDKLQRTAGNCELRSVVLCSHGIKDGRALNAMTKGHNKYFDLDDETSQNCGGGHQLINSARTIGDSTEYDEKSSEVPSTVIIE